MDERGVEQYDVLDFVRIATESQERGLVLKKAALPSEPILILPAESLLNVSTLKGFLAEEALPSAARPSHPYHWRDDEDAEDGAEDLGEPRLPLTSTQALTFILALWRRSHFAHKRKSSLDTLLSSFPDDYSTFPVVWDMLSKDDSKRNRHLYKALLEALPIHTTQLCRKVQKRFHNDCDAIRSFEAKAQHIIDKEHWYPSTDQNDGLSNMDLLWAWYSVNSRCLHIPLGLSRHLDNFTLAPLLDMANHTTDKSVECEVRWNRIGGLQLSAPKKKRNAKGLEAGQEVLITYGAHSNGTLLSEYGFIIPSTSSKASVDDDAWDGNRFAEINIDHIIKVHFARQEDHWGQRKENLLKEHGYYGDYTIHPFPSPVHPSHRLVIALRLLAIEGSDKHKNKKQKTEMANGDNNDEAAQVQAWTEMLRGDREVVSADNERAVHLFLSEICDEVVSDNEEKRKNFRRIEQEHRYPEMLDSKDSQLQANFSIVMDLLREEERIAKMMKDAIKEGLTSW